VCIILKYQETDYLQGFLQFESVITIAPTFNPKIKDFSPAIQRLCENTNIGLINTNS